jgi:phospholipid/cholesterol/gamma-HCH transport system substrate-binding protein
VGKLIESEETHKNLNEALVAVKEGVGGLNKTIGAAARMKVDLGLRSELLTRFSKGKGYFTLDIDPADSSRYYRLELSTQPFGRRSNTRVVDRATFPDGHVETKITETEEFKDDFAISALFGYRWRNFGVRAGVIESKGGAGIDYMTLKDRLRFSADLWDFNRKDFSAHAKVTGRFYFSPSVFVTGGWDDILNHSRDADSLFIGAGIRWSDDDVKYLLGVVPIRR